MVGIPFDVTKTEDVFKDCLLVYILDIINSMKYAREYDMVGIRRVADTSTETMAGMFSTLDHILGIKDEENNTDETSNNNMEGEPVRQWHDNNRLWKDNDEDAEAGSYCYRWIS